MDVRPWKRAKPQPQDDSKLLAFLKKSQWRQAFERATRRPSEVAETVHDVSPLAMACRNGAPLELVQLLLVGAPSLLRSNTGSRGTPLHEAIVCEQAGPDVIQALLQADEALGTDTERATLLQDVDGFIPLHLLIRRRFQSHIADETPSGFMAILESLVRSCPESVTVPDQGEYEEPPIVYALKANIYAPALGSDDVVVVKIEQEIHTMLEIMLRYTPMAAAKVFSGFRGDYSALHSAVFHGRYTTTVNLLLRTEESFPSAPSVAMHTNTQRELPLHFCAMRGERPSTVAALARSAPKAVSMRDASGLTPFHWLWIRFISTVLSLEDDGRSNEIIVFNAGQATYPTTQYNDFTVFEQRDFESDIRLIRRVDPPVDFLRMRHITSEVANTSSGLEQAAKIYDALNLIKTQHRQGVHPGEDQRWTRLEAVFGLFWTKVVSLLEAVKDQPEARLVHTCFATSSCPPPVAHIVASLFPEELILLDSNRRLPIHIAAGREFHSWDWSADSGNTGAANQLLDKETLWAFRVAKDLSPRETLRVADSKNQLVLHIAIDSFVKASFPLQRNTSSEQLLEEMAFSLRELVNSYPESLFRRDGVTKLPPFLQAVAAATRENEAHPFAIQDKFQLTIAYTLLRENPTALTQRLMGLKR